MPRLARYHRKLSRTATAASLQIDRLRGKRVIHFLHVGKTGGTAVRDALESIRDPRYRFFSTLGHNHTLRHVPEGDEAIFFVRDPVSRFVSGFNSRLREGRPRHFWPHSPEERWAFERFRTPNDLALALSDHEQRTDAARAMRAGMHTGTYLSHWLGDLETLDERYGNVLFVGAQENLSRDFGMLADLLDLDVRLPTDPVRSHRSPSSAKPRLDPQAIDNLRAWYGRDYQMLEVLRLRFSHLPCYSDAAALADT